MTAKNNLTSQPNGASIAKKALIGAILGLVLILIFVLQVKSPKPEWGQYWMVRPFIITPLAGAAAGVINALMDKWRTQSEGKKLLANILTVVVYIIGLWMGMVLGLDGTLWD